MRRRRGARRLQLDLAASALSKLRDAVSLDPNHAARLEEIAGEKIEMIEPRHASRTRLRRLDCGGRPRRAVAALGFARAGFDVVSSGADERAGRGRTVALLDRSVAYLKSLGLWAPLGARAAPMRALRLIDDTGALFPPRPLEFQSSEIGLDAFGWNIENDVMAGALAAEIARSSGVERIALGVADYDFSAGPVGARLEDGRTISARLVIGADGRASRRGAPPGSKRVPIVIRRARSPCSPPIGCPTGTSRPNSTPAAGPSCWFRCRRAKRRRSGPASSG